MASKTLIAGASVLALFAAGAAQASTWIASGTGSNGPLDAQADITVSNNQLVITLTDLIANPTSSAQLVSGIEIFLASAPGSASITGDSGTLINISSKKGVTSWTLDTTDTIDHWGTAIVGNALYLSTAGTGAKSGSPDDLIIDGGGAYSNANSSILGHGPDIMGPGVFTLALTGEANPVITGVKIEFGTTPDTSLAAACTVGCDLTQTLTNVQVAVPEPAAWTMMIGGFFGAGLMIRARRRRAVEA